ncbi:hypothetical protein BKA65DRAFT_501401 [Rhexocercosporidium sp. MPI-PUGE-AT-0058]|nr:hypothetical protein BKA65DRAFT_501401 [Rhexocercosporidium sp. MPI-PUGE-AT-0058]
MNVQAKAQSLLEKFDRLTNSERVARMVRLGAESRLDQNVKALINHLESQSLYEQLLSLESCHGSRDLSFAKQVVSASSSKYLKKRAINLIALLGSDEDLLWALQSAPPYLQVATLRRLRHGRGSRKRLAVIEKYLKNLQSEEENVKQFQDLLLLGSEALVERNLSRFLEQFSVQQWLKLAKYHPEIAQRVLDEWIDHSNEDDFAVISKVNTVLNQWLSHDSTVSFAVELFRNALKKMSISRLPINKLVERSPVKAVDTILSCEENLQTVIVEELHWRALRKLPMSSFKPLFERYPGIVEEYEFTLFTPEQRLLAYKKHRDGWRDDDGAIDSYMIAKLPSQERIVEARRHILLKKFETRPSGRIPYIALLPWDDSMELQVAFILSGDAQLRAEALVAQIEAAKFDDTHIEDALKLVSSRKNEQDPVKNQLISALWDIPRGKWEEKHLPMFDEMIANLTKSRDMSTATYRLLLMLLAPILSVHHEWAAAHIGKIMREHDYNSFRIDLSGPVPIKDSVASIERELSPLLEKLLREKDVYSLASLGDMFSEHTKHWVEYLEACEKALQMPDIDKSIYGQLLDILKKHRPRSMTQILPSLIFENATLASEPLVVSQIHHKQQNLLDAYVKESEEELKDRRKALGVLRDGFWWWTPSQQEGLAKILLNDITHDDMSLEDKVKCVEQLSLLPFVNPKPLFKLANSEESAIQEAALRALGQLDGDQGLPALIEALSDERARIAIFSLHKVLKTIPKDKAYELLSSVPQNKVTVAKETVRLIGEMGTEKAFQYLLKKEQTGLHADVRVALYRALWIYLDRHETWEILARAAENPDPKIAKSVCPISEDGLNAQQKQQLLQVLLRLLSHESPEVRIAALERCDTKPLQDTENILAPRLFELIHSEFHDECKGAAKAIFETYSRTNIEQIGDVYRRLLSDRSALKRVHDEYMGIVSPFPGRKYLRPVTHMLLSIFKTDRLSVTRRVKLMFHGLPWDELRPHIFEILPELHADALQAAEIFIEKNETGWKEPQDDLLKVELGMAGSKDERARRLALSFLIGGVDESTGWTDEERYRLGGYRNDTSVLVAEAAWEFNVSQSIEDVVIEGAD